MSVLEELYNGNIRPSEKCIKNGGEYQKLNRQLMEQCEEFIKSLSLEQKQRYEEIENKIYHMNFITEKERFIDGFCLGVNMVLETIGFESDNFV